MSKRVKAVVTYICVFAAVIFLTFIVSTVFSNVIKLSPLFGWLTQGVVFLGIILIILPRLRTSTNTKTSASSSDNIRWRYFRARIITEEIRLIGILLILASAATVGSFFASHAVLVSLQEQRFGPSETAQVITAVGGLGLAVGTSIAAIIKAYALLLRARADVIRAKLELPSSEQPTARGDQ